ncbi:MAG: ATP-binding cassette domain-containing protein [Adlercreutzia equolifaciens]
MLEEVGLTDRADHLPAELSVGQKRRLVLARVLLAQHDLLLADEPTNDLDADWSDEVFDRFRAFRGRRRPLGGRRHARRSLRPARRMRCTFWKRGGLRVARRWPHADVWPKCATHGLWRCEPCGQWLFGMYGIERPHAYAKGVCLSCRVSCRIGAAGGSAGMRWSGRGADGPAANEGEGLNSGEGGKDEMPPNFESPAAPSAALSPACCAWRNTRTTRLRLRIPQRVRSCSA